MKIALIVIVSILLLVLIVLGYYGLFSSIKFEEKEMGSYVLVYDDYVGDYKNSGEIMDKVYYSLIEDSVETTKGFGIYFDNPKEVKREECRSQLGCILEEKDYDKIESLKEKYKVKEFTKTKCVVSEFPHKGSLSIIMGIMKVYPKLEAYIKEKGYDNNPIMELYDTPGKTTYYIMPIKNN